MFLDPHFMFKLLYLHNWCKKTFIFGERFFWPTISKYKFENSKWGKVKPRFDFHYWFLTKFQKFCKQNSMLRILKTGQKLTRTFSVEWFLASLQKTISSVCDSHQIFCSYVLQVMLSRRDPKKKNILLHTKLGEHREF